MHISKIIFLFDFILLFRVFSRKKAILILLLKPYSILSRYCQFTLLCPIYSDRRD